VVPIGLWGPLNWAEACLPPSSVIKSSLMKKIALVIIFAFALLSAVAYPVSAQIVNTLDGLNQTAGEVDAFKNKTSGDYSGFIPEKTGQVIGALLRFIGVLFFILMVYAGISWMTAAGNEAQITKAKSLLMNAVIGIIIVFAAYALTMFIGNEIILK